MGNLTIETLKEQFRVVRKDWLINDYERKSKVTKNFNCIWHDVCEDNCMNCEFGANIEVLAEREYRESLNERQEYYLDIIAVFND